MNKWLLCVFLALLTIVVLTGCTPPSERRDIEKSELAALRTIDSIRGIFFIGIGVIEGDTYYLIYTKNEDGSVSPRKLRATRHVRIYEETREGGTLVISGLFYPKDYHWWQRDQGAPQDTWYELHVPKGSITREFDIR